MNRSITSKELILKESKNIAANQGIQAINIRLVAKQCNVSIGSIYNYFSSKDDLVIATIEDIWKSLFNNHHDYSHMTNFIECVDWFFETIKQGTTDYSDFFLAHTKQIHLSNINNGRKVMEKYFTHIKSGLLYVLKQDSNIKHHVFSDTFSENDFIDFVFQNIIQLLSQNQTNCNCLKEIIKRVLYA